MNDRNEAVYGRTWYTLSAEGVAQLVDLAENGSSPVSAPNFTSRLRDNSADARGRLMALNGRLERRARLDSRHRPLTDRVADR